MNNENICSICYEELENFDENPNIYKLECNHVYHSSCIIKWFRSGHNNCPLCNDTTIDTHLSYYEKISTIEEIKKLGRRKSCPLNIKNILTKIKNCTKEKKEHEKIFNEFKKTHKLIYNTELHTSVWNINTNGVNQIAIFTEHHPAEFERDSYYLRDLEGENIKSLKEEPKNNNSKKKTDWKDKLLAIGKKILSKIPF